MGSPAIQALHIHICAPGAEKVSGPWDTLGQGGEYLQGFWCLGVVRAIAFLPLSLSKMDQAKCCLNLTMLLTLSQHSVSQIHPSRTPGILLQWLPFLPWHTGRSSWWEWGGGCLSLSRR